MYDWEAPEKCALSMECFWGLGFMVYWDLPQDSEDTLLQAQIGTLTTFAHLQGMPQGYRRDRFSIDPRDCEVPKPEQRKSLKGLRGPVSLKRPFEASLFSAFGISDTSQNIKS